MMVADRHLANEHVERFLSAEIVARFFLAQTTILVRSSLQRTMRSGAALRSHEKGYSALLNAHPFVSLIRTKTWKRPRFIPLPQD